MSVSPAGCRNSLGTTFGAEGKPNYSTISLVYFKIFVIARQCPLPQLPKLPAIWVEAEVEQIRLVYRTVGSGLEAGMASYEEVLES